MLKRKALDVAYLKDKDSGLKTFASFENKHDNTNITSEIVSVQSSKMSKASQTTVLAFYVVKNEHARSNRGALVSLTRQNPVRLGEPPVHDQS